jgi:hypothetical protein
MHQRNQNNKFLTSSLEMAHDALSMFREISHAKGITYCEKLLDRINQRLSDDLEYSTKLIGDIERKGSKPDPNNNLETWMSPESAFLLGKEHVSPKN